MASETSEKVAWALLGLAVGAGGMYVLAKEDVWKPNPVNMEENVEVLGTTGDVSALDYGGGVVFRHPDGHIVWEFWDEAEEGPPSPIEGDPNFEDRYTVYSVHLPDPGGVMSYYDWGDWDDVAEAMGQDVDEYREMDASGEPMAAVMLLENLRDMWGPANLDAYPRQMKRHELAERWPMFA